jgi:hypothetical protein
MLRKILITTLPLAALIIMTSLQMSDNGKAGRTGSPGETNCTNCHNSFTLNSGGGSITMQSPGMTGFQYTPGQTYTMSVTVARTGSSLFGVGIEALTSANANAGTLNITDPASTQIKSATVSGVSRRNIVHVLNGGASTDSKVFNFSWTAPAAGTGNVTFYFAGVSAVGTGNGNENNDYVYTSTQVLTEVTCQTPTQPVSITGNNSVCNGATEIYSVAPVAGATTYTWYLPSGWVGTSTTSDITATVTASGTISVTANNACGDSPPATISVTANPLPTPSVSINGDTLQSTPASSYQWYLDGNMINNWVSAYCIPAQNGNYTVQVTDGSGCTGVSTAVYFGSVGINSVNNENGISIYPNPATDYLTVNAPPSLHDFNLTILDITGKVVHQQTLTIGKNNVDLSGFAGGYYTVVSGDQNNKSLTKIFVIK